MTILARVLSARSLKRPNTTQNKGSATIEHNIATLRGFGSTRFVMIEKGSRR